MATTTGTRKRTSKPATKRQPKPVTLEDHLNAWLTGLKTRSRKRFGKTLRKWYHEFLVCSTIAFWAYVAGFILVHVN